LAVSFTQKERCSIIDALRRAAGKSAATVGMRKTTVDTLADEAGISKGAFYKFYPSKEHLFLDVLEQWYLQIFDCAEKVLARCQQLPPHRRAAQVLKAAWREMRRTPLVRFVQEEYPLLVRKMPEDIIKPEYRTVDAFIHAMIESSRVSLTVPPAEAAATVKILLLSLLTADAVGDGFEKALDALVDGACALMIRDDDAQEPQPA
jgi:AcrR family transcriptional regulator